ncbi:MAG: transglycosylase domain-containing protein [Eubacteriales bacterium]|nr:transglycosylase domain-containing protein [Eubacteriales bacterium]
MNFQKRNITKVQNRYRRTGAYLSKKVKTNLVKLFIVTGVYFFVLIAAAGIGTIRGIINNAPNVDNVEITPQAFMTTIYDRDGQEIQRLVQHGSNRIFVPIDQIPKHVQNAFIAIEDERFRSHHGIDLKGIARAAVLGLKRGNFNEGASTITQQLIKNAIFEGGHEPNFMLKLKRKIQEQYLAIEVEKSVTKDKILEGYLNTINLGNNSLGIQTASRRYFDKDVQELTLSEAAVLAAIPQNPTLLNPVGGPERNKERRQTVLDYMLRDEFITQAEYDEAVADDVYARVIEDNVHENIYDFSYFTDSLVLSLVDDMMTNLGYSKKEAYNKLFSGGLKIYSTQDLKIQAICDEEVNRDDVPVDGYTLMYRLTITDADGNVQNLSDQNITNRLREQNQNNEYNILVNSEEEARALIDDYKSSLGTYDEIAEKVVLIPQPQMSFTLMDTHTGEVRAIVGGRGPKDGGLTMNRGTNLYRQPGSTIKPLLDYAPGIDMGMFTKNSTFRDEPYTYPGGGRVNTPYGHHFGNVDMTRALCYSLNVPAIKALQQVGPANAFTYLKRMNFDHILYEPNESGQTDVHLASALGGFTYGVTNLQMTAAYATFGNEGIYNKPRLYTKVLDADGNVLLDNTLESRQIYEKKTARDITDILSQLPKIYIKGVFNENFNEKTTQVACKTGTTDNYMDSWFCGYTAYYTATAWLGYDNYDKSTPDRWQFRTFDRIMTRVQDGLKYKKIYE